MHWHLLAVKVAEKKIEWYNSMPTARSAKPYAVDVASALKEEMVSRGFLDATEFELVTVEDHPQQKTGYDCGIFMVKYMDFLSRDGCDLNFTQDDIPRFRGEIAADIIRGHLM
ncbi:hypothetical protein H6P81_013107 [Aristolochia fimbriata]|uniref:Ubiquitin-like protease family profile domain-containing protein n=1 Tax=Aristolochia fimbriata TaxID=158543 RepID=A0AAV7EFC3_ARIFI|nr:hypothetical protein H6P81_013107 [Aristolochia fimbriata]